MRFRWSEAPVQLELAAVRTYFLLLENDTLIFSEPCEHSFVQGAFSTPLVDEIVVVGSFEQLDKVNEIRVADSFV